MNFPARIKNLTKPILVIFVALFAISFVVIFAVNYQKQVSLQKDLEKISLDKQNLNKELDLLKNQDQVAINKKQQEEINNIQTVYKKTVSVYEQLLDVKPKIKNTDRLDVLFAQVLSFLGKTNYASASSTLAILEKAIQEETSKLTAPTTLPQNITENNAPPSSGYRRQKVIVNGTGFLVDIVSADLNSTKVIVDTASDSTCTDNCPIKPLAEYVSRSGAFAGVNGTYFCPETYPDCANKKNSFDLLVMNKNKTYFNSDNNVYSTNPAVIFSGNSARFVRQTLEWGRDTGVDAIISNYPLLILGNQIVFSGDGVAKHNSKGNRGFIGASGNLVYIGVVHGATVLESAQALHALGINDALNLDDGGSTALWSGGYKVGPGRNLPNAVLLIKK